MLNEAPSAGQLVVSAQGLIRRFGNVHALNGLTFHVATAEMYGLIGPDGAGKTTTMRILAGMIALDDGQVSVLSMNPLGQNPTLRSALGYMPQQYTLYGDLTVEENLRFFSRMFCLPTDEYRERRGRLLAITRLAPFTDRRADALSGGMYKKLALACALLPRPRLLLLDEPTNGVDPVSRRELWALLFELTAEGMSIVISTPYMDEAVRCHRVGLIHQGRIILEGVPNELLANFPQPVFYVRGGTQERCESLLSQQPGVVVSSATGEHLRVVIRREAEAKVREMLTQMGASLEPAQPDFEDLFLAALERD